MKSSYVSVPNQLDLTDPKELNKVLCLLEQQHPQGLSPKLSEAVYRCCYSGSSQCLEILANHNAPLNDNWPTSGSDPYNGSPIGVALARMHMDCVEILVSRNVDISQTDLRFFEAIVCFNGFAQPYPLSIIQEKDIDTLVAHGLSLKAPIPDALDYFLQVMLNGNIDWSRLGTNAWKALLKAFSQQNQVSIQDMLCQGVIDQVKHSGSPNTKEVLCAFRECVAEEENDLIRKNLNTKGKETLGSKKM